MDAKSACRRKGNGSSQLGASDPQNLRTYDPVNAPHHYQCHPSGVECITVAEHMSFCIGNAMKYLWRADYKGGVEDLKKAAWYIDREIKRREKAAAAKT